MTSVQPISLTGRPLEGVMSISDSLDSRMTNLKILRNILFYVIEEIQCPDGVGGLSGKPLTSVNVCLSSADKTAGKEGDTVTKQK